MAAPELFAGAVSPGDETVESLLATFGDGGKTAVSAGRANDLFDIEALSISSRSATFPRATAPRRVCDRPKSVQAIYERSSGRRRRAPNDRARNSVASIATGARVVPLRRARRVDNARSASG